MIAASSSLSSPAFSSPAFSAPTLAPRFTPVRRHLAPVQAQTLALQRHLQHCRRARGRWFDAALLAEQAHRFIAPRFVTTVAAVSGVLALSLGWL
jgi:hypothetical protein